MVRWFRSKKTSQPNPPASVATPQRTSTDPQSQVTVDMHNERAAHRGAPATVTASDLGPIEIDPDSGALVLPRNPEADRYAIGMSVWEDDDDGFKAFAAYHAERSPLRIAPTEHDYDDEDDEVSYWSDVIVELEPRPDNPVNSAAIAVVVPEILRATVGAHHIGYMYERHLSIYGRNLHALFTHTGRPIHMHAIIVYSGSASQRQGRRKLSPKKLRLAMPQYRHLAHATTASLADHGSNMVAPSEARWASSRKELRDQLTEDRKHKDIPAIARIEDGELRLYIDGHFMSVLHPHPRGLFHRLHDTAVQRGGQVGVLAYVSRSAVRVYVHDSSPATG